LKPACGFSELGGGRLPVKTYSSGIVVRLAFALVTAASSRNIDEGSQGRPALPEGVDRIEVFLPTMHGPFFRTV
jgi:hypothetical protein